MAHTHRSLSRYIVNPVTSCWEWSGCRCRDGYGKVRLRIAGERFYLAHRASYFAANGSIPFGAEVDHECKNRSCINPAHLRAVTHAVNVSTADYRSNNRNGRKTHCMRGHALEGRNLMVEKSKTGVARKCRQCKTDREAAKRHLMAARGLKIVEVK